MRLLADENMPRSVVDALRDSGHDVIWIRTESPGLGDAAVLQRAVRDRRTLLTFDKDFGELAGQAVLPDDVGVILFRSSAGSPRDLASAVVRSVNARDDWGGHISVIEPGRLRMRRTGWNR
jgi:predicted nuclease of predicted toxin-antitoxin system